jgi:hypothetical protein
MADPKQNIFEYLIEKIEEVDSYDDMIILGTLGVILHSIDYTEDIEPTTKEFYENILTFNSENMNIFTEFVLLFKDVFPKYTIFNFSKFDIAFGGAQGFKGGAEGDGNTTGAEGDKSNSNTVGTNSNADASADASSKSNSNTGADADATGETTNVIEADQSISNADASLINSNAGEDADAGTDASQSNSNADAGTDASRINSNAGTDASQSNSNESNAENLSNSNESNAENLSNSTASIVETDSNIDNPETKEGNLHEDFVNLCQVFYETEFCPDTFLGINGEEISDRMGLFVMGVNDIIKYRPFPVKKSISLVYYKKQLLLAEEKKFSNHRNVDFKHFSDEKKLKKNIKIPRDNDHIKQQIVVLDDPNFSSVNEIIQKSNIDSVIIIVSEKTFDPPIEVRENIRCVQIKSVDDKPVSSSRVSLYHGCGDNIFEDNYTMLMDNFNLVTTNDVRKTLENIIFSNCVVYIEDVEGSGKGPEMKGPEVESGDGSEVKGPEVESGDGSEVKGPEVESGDGSEMKGPEVESGDGSEVKGPEVESGDGSEVNSNVSGDENNKENKGVEGLVDKDKAESQGLVSDNTESNGPEVDQSEEGADGEIVIPSGSEDGSGEAKNESEAGNESEEGADGKVVTPSGSEEQGPSQGSEQSEEGADKNVVTNVETPSGSGEQEKTIVGTGEDKQKTWDGKKLEEELKAGHIPKINEQFKEKMMNDFLKSKKN